MGTDDSMLLHHLLAGDRRTVSRFYREYAGKLRRYIRHKIGSEPDAEEVLQDTLFAFLEGLRDFSEKSSIRTYIYSICKYKIVDYYRRKKIKLLVFSQVPGLESLVSPLLGPEAQLDTALVREKISRVFARMAPDYRQILVLKYLEEVSVGDIAQKLSISFKSAESRLFRARKNFVEVFLSI